MIREDLELVTIEHLDFQPACEASSHSAGKWGHVPAEPARYAVSIPCGKLVLMCAGWVAQLASHTTLECIGGCGGLHSTSEVTVTPLDAL